MSHGVSLWCWTKQIFDLIPYNQRSWQNKFSESALHISLSAHSTKSHTCTTPPPRVVHTIALRKYLSTLGAMVKALNYRPKNKCEFRGSALQEILLWQCLICSCRRCLRFCRAIRFRGPVGKSCGRLGRRRWNYDPLLLCASESDKSNARRCCSCEIETFPIKLY